MSYTTLPIGSIGELKAIVRNLWSLMKSNLEDHSQRINDLNAGGSPTGMIAAFGNSTPPTGWLLCDGSAVSQTTYADLYSIIGTTFNTGGEGAGNFRLPDLKGRLPIGNGQDSGLSLTDRTIGTKLGEETHVLTTSELPAHTHTITDPGHFHGSIKRKNAAGGAQATAQDNVVVNSANFRYLQYASTGITIDNAGSGSGHNNVQPFLVAAYIIKT